jgi:hypothetical protein
MGVRTALVYCATQGEEEMNAKSDGICKIINNFLILLLRHYSVAQCLSWISLHNILFIKFT